jgi:hypothetical protein
MNSPFFKVFLLVFLIISNIQILHAQLFEEQTSAISITSEYYSSLEWGDYDNDNDLDLLVTCSSYPQLKTKVLKNNGNGTFTEDLGVVLPGLNSGNSIWLDYNNDGYLDILLCGNTNQGRIFKIFKNNLNNTFSEQIDIPVSNNYNLTTLAEDYDNDGDIDIFVYYREPGSYQNNYQDHLVVKIEENCGNDLFVENDIATFQGARNGNIEIVDYNNDGYLDLSVIGDNYMNATVKIFKNSGNGAFEEQENIVFPSFSSMKMNWADFNNDGYIDLLLNGYLNYNPSTIIYKNNGDETFTAQTDIQFNIQGANSINWGDFNSDGYSDLFVYQGNGSETILKVFINNANNSFTEQVGIPLPNTQFGTLSWGDFDNDHRSDFVLSGYILGPVTKLFKNIDVNINTIPTTPSNLNTSISNHNVDISWDKSTDGMANPDGLSYNLYLSTVSNKETVKPAMSDILNGYRKVAKYGNNSNLNQSTIKGLNGGETYYWSVQALDKSFTGSAFATEQTFTMPIIRPDIQVSNLIQTDGTMSSVTVKWTNGNSTKRVVFISESSAEINFPEDFTTYSPNIHYGLGSEITGSGLFCVYNGTGNNLTITGLESATDYKVYAFEYDGTAGNEQYNISTESSNVNLVETSFFEEQTNFILPNSANSSAVWGDFDNDDDLDIVITGQGPNTKIFRNDLNNNFTEITVPFSGKTSLKPNPWGDFDNDGDLDLILNATSGAYVYNNENSNFIQQTTLPNFSGSFGSSFDWGDYDNDGDLDLIVSYNWYGGPIYKNNGDSTFTNQEQLLPKLDGVPGVVLWGDINNDSYLDIIISGGSSGSPYLTIFKNNEGTSFTELTNINITEVMQSSLCLGDYNSDGYLDILFTGEGSNGSITKVYKNNGNETFAENTICQLTGLTNGSSEWGDYDNDGDLDILMTGSLRFWGSESFSKIYKNMGNDNFVELVADKFPGVSEGSSNWGDYDNDGDLDFILTGNAASGKITKVYKNISKKSNTAPSTPVNLQCNVQGNQATLTWNKSSDNETSQNGLSYNLYISTQSLKENIKPGMSNIANGFRKIVKIGNASSNNYTIKELIAGQTYYWGVQAIDNTFKGSAYAAEQSFTVSENRPNIQTSELVQTGATSSTILSKWKNGNGPRRVVFICRNGSENAVPSDNITYQANTIFGLGTEIANSGWFCAYNGVDDYLEVTGLEGISKYKIAIFEYDGTPGKEKYNKEISDENLKTMETSIFEEQINININSVIYGTIRWGDYDNDGDLDLLCADYGQVNLYKNNGNNNFQIQTNMGFQPMTFGCANFGDMNNDGLLDIILSGVLDNSSVPDIRFTIFYKNNGNNTFSNVFSINLSSTEEDLALGDYNNDGLLDFIMSYYDGITKKTGIFKNNGDNSFSEQTDISLPDAGNSVSWADYNNDGDLDILLTGYSNAENNYISKLYKNNGDNTFIEHPEVNFKNLYGGASVWADFNNDGFVDLLLSGTVSASSSEMYTKIYKNNGNGSFTEQTELTIPPLGHWAVVQAGDYNNDTYLDILCAGYSYDGHISKIFKNEGNFKFTEQIPISITGMSDGDGQWGDYDNDGDLDFILTGRPLEPVEFAIVYKNLIIDDKQAKTQNVIPELPQNISVNVLEQDDTYCKLKFSWDKAIDEETPQNGLNYNVYLGSISESQDITNSMSLSSGQRKIVSTGNAGPNNFYIIDKILLDQQYYFGVQAIDGGYKGSEFLTIDKNTLGVLNIPNMNIYNIYPNPASEKIKINGLQDEVQMEIIDLNGQVLISKNIIKNNEIDVSGLKSGTYLVKLTEKNSLIIKKLIKN